MILVNSVFTKVLEDSENNTRYRIVAIDLAQDIIVIFDIDNKSRFPEFIPYRAFEESLSQGIYEFATDPYSSTVRHVSEATKARRDQAYASIKELVTQHHWDLFY